MRTGSETAAAIAAALGSYCTRVGQHVLHTDYKDDAAIFQRDGSPVTLQGLSLSCAMSPRDQLTTTVDVP